MSHRANYHLHRLGIAHSLHSLRHGFATNVYRQSKDLLLTQNLLGHASPEMTAIYAAADQSGAEAVVANLTI